MPYFLWYGVLGTTCASWGEQPSRPTKKKKRGNSQACAHPVQLIAQGTIARERPDGQAYLLVHHKVHRARGQDVGVLCVISPLVRSCRHRQK